MSEGSPSVDELMALLFEHNPPAATEEPVVNRNLSGRQFYHGTTREFSEGDEVLPWRVLRERGIVQGESANNAHLAFATEDPQDAAGRGNSLNPGEGRVRVYPVEPIDPEEIHLYRHGPTHRMSSTRGFRVTGPEVEQ